MEYQSRKEASEFLDLGIPPKASAGMFGADPSPEESEVVLLPVEWDGTASYGKGTVEGPKAILRASHQLDLMDPVFGCPYRSGLSLLRDFEAIPKLERPQESTKAQIVETGKTLNQKVFDVSRTWIEQGKIVGVVGGEHSAPLGAILALDKQEEEFGILHLDAHHDLRANYEGFENSHASIIHNVIHSCSYMSKIVSVGVRDYSLEESNAAIEQNIITFYDNDIKRRLFSGEFWAKVVGDIIDSLPQRVYISFDIDCLMPDLCPNTGTPVPGGLGFEQVCFLLEELAQSGRRIVGFDLCEVSPGQNDDWDANVGARILYKLCGAAVHSMKETGA